MFYDHLDTFQKPSLGGIHNIRPEDHNTPKPHNRWFIAFYYVWGPHLNRNSLNSPLVEVPVTYAFTLQLTACDHTTWFWKRLGHFFRALVISWSRLLPCVWSDPLLLCCWSVGWLLGLLHTQAKGHDHVIVRTLDSHPKAILVTRSLKICIKPTSHMWAWCKYLHITNIIHTLPCMNLCTTHDNFFVPLDLHLLVWSELGWSRPFRPIRSLECNGHGPSVSCVKWPYGVWGPRIFLLWLLSLLFCY